MKLLISLIAIGSLFAEDKQPAESPTIPDKLQVKYYRALATIARAEEFLRATREEQGKVLKAVSEEMAAIPGCDPVDHPSEGLKCKPTPSEAAKK